MPLLFLENAPVGAISIALVLQDDGAAAACLACVYQMLLH
jgi:hypothetical protein